MTINEMIKELQELANNGCGDYTIINAEGDNVCSLFEDGRDDEGNKALVIYF